MSKEFEQNKTNGIMERSPASFEILGTRVSITSIDRVLSLFEEWCADRRDRFVVFRDVHGIMRARHDPLLREAHQRADLVAPDGLPIVWAARMSGIREISRVCGPDILPAACAFGVSRGWRHYFYGGAEGIAETLATELAAKFPGIIIAGTMSPPFRNLSTKKDMKICSAIRSARPDFVWVGLGTPKQEIWMMEHRGRLGGAIMLGVGAAFDIHAGFAPRAPRWMQENGLEWAFRLAKEPFRLWRRYLVLAPGFILLLLFDALKVLMKRFHHTQRVH